MNAEPFLLYGTHETEEAPVRLAAGRLSADLADGNLRTITYDGVEVLRAISYLVRDRDWGTYSPRIENLKVQQLDEVFIVGYRAHCDGPAGTELSIDVRIAASEGRLTFESEAQSDTGFETNRCGFCILHPIVGVAGSPILVEHVDGQRHEALFPDLIEPWQPFKDMRAITHTVAAGVTAECRMEGDTFEMEDQRNWSDASYKTYVRPLALPWPYQIPAGEPLRQRVVLSVRDERAGATAIAAGSHAAITLRPGPRRGRMPAIGLVITPEEAKPAIAAHALLIEVGPQELLFHFDPVSGHDLEALTDFAQIAARHPGRTTLEIALPCRSSPLDEALAIARQLRSAGFAPDTIVISPSVDRQSTPPGSQWPACPPLDDVYAAAHAAFPNTRIGGGMLSYFTELNRKRVPPEKLSLFSHCTNPIVHAADDLSVMQTLEALPFITRSVRAIYGDKPYRIGPSTIAMRQNPYGSRTMDNPGLGRIPMANRDPRHNGLFAEAFALGYAIRVLDADLECLTLSALTGAFGLLAGSGEPTPEGGKRPLFRTVAALAGLAGASWRACVSSDPSQVLAFMADGVGETTLHLVNLTPTAKTVDLRGLELVAGRGSTILAPYAVEALSLVR